MKKKKCPLVTADGGELHKSRKGEKKEWLNSRGGKKRQKFILLYKAREGDALISLEGKGKTSTRTGCVPERRDFLFQARKKGIPRRKRKKEPGKNALNKRGGNLAGKKKKNRWNRKPLKGKKEGGKSPRAAERNQRRRYFLRADGKKKGGGKARNSNRPGGGRGWGPRAVPANNRQAEEKETCPSIGGAGKGKEGSNSRSTHAQGKKKKNKKGGVLKYI